MPTNPVPARTNGSGSGVPIDASGLGGSMPVKVSPAVVPKEKTKLETVTVCPKLFGRPANKKTHSADWLIIVCPAMLLFALV